MPEKMTRMSKQAEIGKLEKKLGALQRELEAYRELYRVGVRVPGQAPRPDVELAQDGGIRVLLYGLDRHHGGVVVLNTDGFYDSPELLDDALPRWRNDRTSAFRSLARRVEALRDARNKDHARSPESP